VLASVGCGLPAIVLAGGFAWLCAEGYPLAWLGMVASAAAGMRGVYLAIRGGVTLSQATVEVRGWWTSEQIDRSSIRSVVERVDRTGEPTGWLVRADDQETRLRGATARHRHSPYRKDRCSTCEADRANLVRIARDLAVPLIRGGAAGSA